MIRTETYGAALRTAPDDAGLAVGYTSTLFVVPESAKSPAVGTYPFGISMRDLPVAAMVRRVAGIDLGVNRTMVGVMLGFSEDAALAMAPADPSTARRLVLIPDDPARTELRICEESARCD